MVRAALIGDNSIEYIEKLLQIWEDDDCAVLIDWRIPFERMVEMMREAEVKYCYIDRECLNGKNAEDVTDIEFKAYESSGREPRLLPDAVRNCFKANYSRSEAVVIYSSGTTGKAKGVILSHYAINTNADAIIRYMNPSAGDCICIAKTLSHSSTLTGELLAALKSGMGIVVSPVIVPPRCIFNNIMKFSVTILCVNPTLLRLISIEHMKKRYDDLTLKKIYVSGSVLDDQTYELAHEAFDKIPIYNVYGLSELAPRVTAQTESCCKSNSVGKPIHGVEIAIVNENGETVSVGIRGIIHVNSPSVFDGYVSGDLKYKSLYRGWLNTGDTGYIDEHGELHVCARIDDVMIINSHKIYPIDVENAICTVAGVSECAVSKIVYRGMETIGCLYTGEASIKDITANIKSRLASYEIPKRFIRVDSLPKSANGKLLRNEVRKILEENP